ncbi:MAG: sigma-70 family RNA polymerase sigma factor [Rhodospirillaceae bacterium]|nr:sigma-70 family RNA polymerase sigma factor [Rhodospirillaceae bacterium]
MTRSPEDAVDIVQEATLRALRFFDSFRGGDARPWFLGIVRNTTWTSLGANRRKETTSLDDSDIGDPEARGLLDRLPAAGDDPEAALGRAEERSRLEELILRLPASFRECLVLSELEELSYREIAAIVGAPVGAMMSRLARARRLLVEYGRALRHEEAGHGL